MSGFSRTKKSVDADVQSALAWLKRHSTRATLEGMARYAIPSDKALGVAMKDIKTLGRKLGRNHELAAALWETGVYEARMAASFVDDPAQVTPAQMDRWCKDFDNWGVCDTLCFKLFDQTPHAWAMVNKWSTRRDEYQKRAAFALMASLALHDKKAPDAPFIKGLVLIEKAASDERNFVKKGVSWALRGVGRRSLALNADSVALARRLAASDQASARWIGKDALRELTSPAVARRLAAKRQARRASK